MSGKKVTKIYEFHFGLRIYLQKLYSTGGVGFMLCAIPRKILKQREGD